MSPKIPPPSVSPARKFCVECSGVLPMNSELCPECGYESAVFGYVPAADGVRVAVRYTVRPATEDEKRAFYKQQVAIAAKCGYDARWVMWAYKAKFNELPSRVMRAA